MFTIRERSPKISCCLWFFYFYTCIVREERGERREREEGEKGCINKKKKIYNLFKSARGIAYYHLYKEILIVNYSIFTIDEKKKDDKVNN